MVEIDWLQFITQLPTTPSSLRVLIWRRLRDAGAVSLQNGVWILPRSDENTVFLERLLGYIRQNGASGQIFMIKGITEAVNEDIQKHIIADRDQEYEELIEQCTAFMDEVKKETINGKFTFAELEENEQNLQRLQKWIARIQKRDHLKAGKSQQAVKAYQSCVNSLQEYTRAVYTREGIAVPPDFDFQSGDISPTSQEVNDDLK